MTNVMADGLHLLEREMSFFFSTKVPLCRILTHRIFCFSPISNLQVRIHMSGMVKCFECHMQLTELSLLCFRNQSPWRFLPRGTRVHVGFKSAIDLQLYTM